jgi:hypothetical protein
MIREREILLRRHISFNGSEGLGNAGKLSIIEDKKVLGISTRRILMRRQALLPSRITY